MRHRVLATIIVVLVLMALLAGAVYAAFPAPPGNQCPIPTGVVVGAGFSASDHSQVLVAFPVTNGAGIVTPGCTLSQDTITIYVDGPRSAYLLNVTQYIPETLTTTHVVNNTTVAVTTPIRADVVTTPITVSAVPWYWSSVTVNLQPTSVTKTVNVTLVNSTASLSFLHLTPASLLPILGSIGQQWSVGVELLIVGTVVAAIGFLAGRVTIRRLGVRPAMNKVAMGYMAGLGYYLMVLFSDYSGVTYALGGAASYVMVAAPTFVAAWLIGIPEGESKTIKLRRHLPDVAGVFDDKAGGRQ